MDSFILRIFIQCFSFLSVFSDCSKCVCVCVLSFRHSHFLRVFPPVFCRIVCLFWTATCHFAYQFRWHSFSLRNWNTHTQYTHFVPNSLSNKILQSSVVYTMWMNGWVGGWLNWESYAVYWYNTSIGLSLMSLSKWTQIDELERFEINNSEVVTECEQVEWKIHKKTHTHTVCMWKKEIMTERQHHPKWNRLESQNKWNI